ncbi:MAG TPA: hypothetical protein VLV87_10900 [Gammaproteobacteria bacterium]|nr:hypothetical protein [Gammaproteobacteria bacterium]
MCRSLVPTFGVGVLVCLVGAIWTAAAAADAANGAPPTATHQTPSVAHALAIAQADHSQDWGKVTDLGRIEVNGDREANSRKIIAGLKVIKRALNNALTNDPADANKVICRMNYDTGSHLRVHLRCATNAALNAERRARGSTVGAVASAEPAGAALPLLEHLDPASAGDRYFSTIINAGELQKLLLEVQCAGCSNSGLVVGDN